jgi:exonuclease SbcC
MIEDVKMMNFISHRETSIQLEDGVNVFIGPNGAGKSSVVDAVTYALYGEHTRDSAKNIVRRGAANGFVSVTFTVGNRQYRAERRFGPKGKLEGAILREIRCQTR